jgi:PP-loop superfamily ATP-utilizing enzyme
MTCCTSCLLTDKYPGISFSQEGLCSLCSQYKPFVPVGEEKLLQVFHETALRNRAPFDALVPLSGGKDSTYILHLAVNVFKLKVMTMTYDNGFLTPRALGNIDRAVKKSGVNHEFFRCEPHVLQEVYRTTLLASGDICGACDIATKAAVFYISKKTIFL